MEKLFKGLFALAILLVANDIGGWGLIPTTQVDLSKWSNVLLSPVYRTIERQTGV
jgi:hypothetical protein